MYIMKICLLIFTYSYNYANACDMYTCVNMCDRYVYDMSACAYVRVAYI